MSFAIRGGAPNPAPQRSAAASGRRQRLIPRGTTWRSLPGGRRRHFVDGRRHVDGLEIGRADDLEVLYVFRVVVQVMRDAWPLVADVAGLSQGRLVLIHEARPAPGHDHEQEFAFVLVP